MCESRTFLIDSSENIERYSQLFMEINKLLHTRKCRTEKIQHTLESTIFLKHLHKVKMKYSF